MPSAVAVSTYHILLHLAVRVTIQAGRKGGAGRVGFVQNWRAGGWRDRGFHREGRRRDGKTNWMSRYRGARRGRGAVQ